MSKINIAGTLHNTEEIQGDELHSHVVVESSEVLDVTKGAKQSDVNTDLQEQLDQHQSLIVAIDSQNYVTVSATSSTTDVSELITDPAIDTIYRVAKWDGTQYDTTTYSEYAYDGTNLVLLDVKSYGIDEEPTAGSSNLVKSGGVERNLYNSIGSIFAINSFCGLRVSNFNTGKISKAGIVDDVSVNGICIPVNAGDVYKFEDITLWHPNTSIGKQVKVYNEYPTINNSTDTCVGSVAVFNDKFTMPSGAKYMVVTCAVSECGNNMRIIQVHDDEELAKIKEWILSESYTVESVTRDSDGNVSSANVTFPDGVTGSISLTRNSDGDATVENVVYGSDTYRLTITRNSNGDVTATSLTKI